MATVLQVNAYVDAAVAAIDAEQWSVAERKLMAALAALSGIPDGGAGSQQMRYDRRTLLDMLNNVKAKAATEDAATAGSSGGIKRVGINYVNPVGAC